MRGIIFISFLFSVILSTGQDNPSLTISPKKIKIGEQAKLTLSYSYTGDDSGKNMVWPKFADTLVSKIEILEKGKISSAELKSGKKGMSQTFIITSFDSGYYAIPPMQIIHLNDTLFSNPVLLDVKSVDVDTTRAFKKIKGIYETTLSWSDYFKMIGDWIKDNIIILLLAILVVIAGILYYLWWKKRKKPEVIVPVAIIPPHVIALEELEKLRQKKLWQEGNIKPYYIELTDILRNYIEQRFLIHAMEQTTEEIMSQLRLTDISEISKLTLVPVLKLSDLVKFAKENPMGMENDEMLQRAIDFVTSTIPVQKSLKEKNN